MFFHSNSGCRNAPQSYKYIHCLSCISHISTAFSNARAGAKVFKDMPVSKTA